MSREHFRRRRLPHWDVAGAAYFVTTCLAGSIPAQGLLDIDKLRERMCSRSAPASMSANDWKRHQWNQTFASADDWLDRRPAVNHLAAPRLASEIVSALRHFRGTRYEIYAYVVMPSHLHWVFRPLDRWISELGSAATARTPRERIMHTLKLRTSRECNRLLGREGSFWQDESYDHCVFDMEELGRIIQYIEDNPVKAGLVREAAAWKFSSASERAETRVPVGEPLV